MSLLEKKTNSWQRALKTHKPPAETSPCIRGRKWELKRENSLITRKCLILRCVQWLEFQGWPSPTKPILLLCLRKLRPRELQWFVQGHTVLVAKVGFEPNSYVLSRKLHVRDFLVPSSSPGSYSGGHGPSTGTQSRGNKLWRPSKQTQPVCPNPIAVVAKWRPCRIITMLQGSWTWAKLGSHRGL